MANVIDATTSALLAELDRLSKLNVADPEAVKAECDRATALNNTARNVKDLGDLYMRAEMLQMSNPERGFRPGVFFAQRELVDVNKRNLGQPATAWGDGSRTRINALGEFEEAE